MNYVWYNDGKIILKDLDTYMNTWIMCDITMEDIICTNAVVDA